jgi:hypothetical protein
MVSPAFLVKGSGYADRRLCSVATVGQIRLPPTGVSEAGFCTLNCGNGPPCLGLGGCFPGPEPAGVPGQGGRSVWWPCGAGRAVRQLRGRLARVNGAGQAKLARHGQQILETLA